MGINFPWCTCVHALEARVVRLDLPGLGASQDDEAFARDLGLQAREGGLQARGGGLGGLYVR